MLQEINHLRAIADHCRKGDALDPQLAVWLASCLDSYLTRQAEDMEKAFGIRNARGGVPWRVEEAIRRRDAALRALALQLPATGSLRARAQAICTLCVRYAASSWHFDRLLADMPAAYVGTPKAHLWAAFQSGAPMPIGTRRLVDIIGGCFGNRKAPVDRGIDLRGEPDSPHGASFHGGG